MQESDYERMYGFHKRTVWEQVCYFSIERYKTMAYRHEYDHDNGVSYGFRPGKLIAIFGVAVGIGLIAFGFWFYFGWLENIPKEQFVLVTKKHGKPITNEMILAPDSSYQGPQKEMLMTGYKVINPIMNDWTDPIPATNVPNDQVAVLTRLYGEPLPEGEYIAWKSEQKGIVPEPKAPGLHYINTFEYDVKIVDMQKIEPGFAGVVTLLSGKEPKEPNAFVVEEGEKGVQPFLLQPGTHPQYSNPYVYLVTPIDVRSHKFEFELVFLSMMGFEVSCEGTIEWAPDLAKLPELFVKFVTEDDIEKSGGIDNIEQNLIMPSARGFFYMVGGKHRAVSFMMGDTRASVQKEVEEQLKVFCGEEGIDIKSVVIRDARPDKRIRDQYARREIANREIDRFEEEIKMQIGEVVLEGAKPKMQMVAKVEADGTQALDQDGKPVMVETPILDEYGREVMDGGKPKVDEEGKFVRKGGRIAQMIEERRKDRESQLGKVRSEVAVAVREAEQYEKVEVTKAEKELEVAKIGLEAATDKAEAVRKEGIAEANVVIMNATAEARGIEATVKAFDGDGEKYADYELLKKFGPSVRNVNSNTSDSFAARLVEKFTGTEEKKSDK